MRVYSFLAVLAWLVFFMGVVLYIAGFFNFDQNAAINECIRAGNEWTGSSCK